MRFARAALVALVLTSGACAGRSNPGTSAGRDPRVIRLEEIQNAAATGVSNVFDLVSRLHPEWLRASTIGVTGRTVEPMVWLDGQRLGGLNAMRTVNLGVVTQVRYMNASEAQGNLGLDNLGGAIVLTSGVR